MYLFEMLSLVTMILLCDALFVTFSKFNNLLKVFVQIDVVSIVDKDFAFLCVSWLSFTIIVS